jgi:hypothetical protein
VDTHATGCKTQQLNSYFPKICDDDDYDDNDNTNCTMLHGIKHFEPTRIGSYNHLYIHAC